MDKVSKPVMDEQLDFDLDMDQWEDIEQEGEFAWSGPDGRPLADAELEEPNVEPVGFQSDEIVLPPERVRFATLVNIKAVGEQNYFEGVIVNLSTDGVACVCAAPMEKGKRVWITFRLGLIDDPISLLCEIVWERIPESGEPSYGLRFLELGAPEKQRIEDVVRERSEGRAGEWPLPVIPNIGATQKARVNPWLSGSLGLAMGLGIAFAASTIPLPELTAASLPGQLFTKSVPVTQPKKLEEKKEKPVATLIAETREEKKKPLNKAKKLSKQRAKKEKKKALPKTVTNERFESGTTEIIIKKKNAQAKRVDKAKSLAAPAPSKAKTVQLKPTVTYATRLEGESIIPISKSKNLFLDLRTEKPVSHFKTFWLSSPRRIVVDVPKNWSNFDRLDYRVDHDLAKKVRIGQYKTKVRFVIETAEKATGEAMIKNGQLMVELTGR